MNQKAWILVAGAVAAPLMPDAVFAATAAYWRHEEGPAGQLVPDGPDTVLDSSGNGNHMRTFQAFSGFFTSPTYSSSISPLPLRSGLDNNLSLDFGFGSDGVTPEGAEPNDDNYADFKPIATQLFTEMTFELAFNMKSIGGFQTLFAKDGKPLGDEPGEPDEPIPPLAIKVRGDSFPDDVPNQLFVEWIDGDGDIHFLTTRETVVADQWMHVAFTLSGTDAELWVAEETGDYVLKDSVNGEDFAGESGEVLIFEPLGFAVGRGFFNNGPADWSDAFIDEVRVSDQALTSDQFLFETAPAANPDRDDDDDVDGRDLVAIQRTDPSLIPAWQAQFGTAVALGAVPEPTAWTLVASAWGCCRLGRRRRSQTRRRN